VAQGDGTPTTVIFWLDNNAVVHTRMSLMTLTTRL
jgi:hypothetical protein